MCALCYVLSSVVLFSLYLLVGGGFYIQQSEWNIIRLNVLLLGRAALYDTKKRVWWEKSFIICA